MGKIIPFFSATMILALGLSQAQEDINVGPTGWDIKRPVMAADGNMMTILK